MSIFNKTLFYLFKLPIAWTVVLDQREDMDGFDELMDHFVSTKYRSQFETIEKYQRKGRDDADELYKYLVCF